MSSSIQEEPEIEWRSTCNSQETRKLYILDHGLFSDVTFIVGDKGEVIRGHRLILSVGSPVFQAMLIGKPMNESPIPIPDIQPSGFKHLLKYLYSHEIPVIPEKDYMEFLRAVKHFKVEELYEDVKKHILEKLTLQNALNVFEEGKLLGEKELEGAADKLIKKNAVSILAQPKFSELSAENLLHFISSDDFSAPEVPLCQAVHIWGEAECERQNLEKKPENLRLVLKDIIPQIRFPLMNPSDFSLKIVFLDLLTVEETVAILLYFNVAQKDRHKIPGVGRFISKPRYFYTDKIPDIPDEDYMEFFRAVKYFMVEELYEVGRKNILEKLALDNAINVFENGKLLEEKELEGAADKFIKKNAVSILAQTKFSELSAENLLHFISSDDFSAPEIPICLAVYNWGEAECERQKLEMNHENLRLVLKDIFPEIRFPLMKPLDFSLKIASLNLLTLEETVNILIYFNVVQNDRNKIPHGYRIFQPRVYVNYEDEDKVDNVVWTLDGINTGLRTDNNSIYTISNKGVGSANYLNMYTEDYGVVATKNLAEYEFEGDGYCSTFWGIRRGSEPNTYNLFSKYGNGHVTWLKNNFFDTVFFEPDKKKIIKLQNLIFEPSKNAPGYFLMTTDLMTISDKYMVLALSEDPCKDGFYAKFIEKPEEEVDAILWKIQKIQM